MTEQEMEKADGEMLSRKIDNATNILYKVNISPIKLKYSVYFIAETTFKHFHCISTKYLM